MSCEVTPLLAQHEQERVEVGAVDATTVEVDVVDVDVWIARLARVAERHTLAVVEQARAQPGVAQRRRLERALFDRHVGDRPEAVVLARGAQAEHVRHVVLEERIQWQAMQRPGPGTGPSRPVRSALIAAVWPAMKRSHGVSSGICVRS
jgi:hypothetical protein